MDNIHSTEWLLLIALFLHILVAPFTKVEESFNVQAIHDLLYHRLEWAEYDHHEFPGVVPRTFIGPLSIASILFPFRQIFDFFKVEKYWLLFAARFTIGLAVLIAFCGFVRSIDHRFGRPTGTFLRLITLTQFHFLFYASRPLPNTFALIFVLLVYQKWIDGDLTGATIYASIATCLLRFELILLFGPLFLLIFAQNRHSIVPMLLVGILTVLSTLAISIPFDSFMWQKWIWPEGEVIRFNILLNRSHEYGVSPFWWYFTSALPRTLLLSIFLVPLGALIHQHHQRALIGIVFPAFAFIALYSFLPHKELRFILYAVPILNVSSSVFCAWIWNNATRSCIRRLLALLVILHLVANLIISGHFIYASSRNYPGGEALMILQHRHRFLRNKPISIHIDNYCAETGVSRFLHLFDAWEYNKTENLSAADATRFDYLLVGADNKKKFEEDFAQNNLTMSHKEYFAVDGFHKISWLRLNRPKWLTQYGLIRPYRPQIKLKQKVVVFKKI